MIISDPIKQQDQQIFNNFPAAIRDKIEKSSVKLQSLNGQFVGSGVIFFAPANQNIAVVLTAKHNLWVYAGKDGPPAWNSQEHKTMETNFLANIQILYNNLQSAARLTGSIGYAGQKNWEYDLMLLQCSDANFLTFARQNCIISNSGDRDKALDFFYRGTVWDVNSNVYMQTGFGKQSDTSPSPGGPFQYRSTRPNPTKTVDVKAGVANQAIYKEVILLTANDDTTTASGDSGGPLFAVYRNQELYLVGGTLGSNFSEDEVLPDKPIQNNASTSVQIVLEAIQLPN